MCRPATTGRHTTTGTGDTMQHLLDTLNTIATTTRTATLTLNNGDTYTADIDGITHDTITLGHTHPSGRRTHTSIPTTYIATATAA